jgi:hypothetical protein
LPVRVRRACAYPCDHPADGLDLVEHSSEAVRHLLSDLLVLLAELALLLLLRRLHLLLRDLVEKRDMADGLALAIDNTTFAIDLLARADTEFTGSELADDVPVGRHGP